MLLVSASEPPKTELLSHLGRSLFELSLLSSLIIKHPGFKEEAEWRILYLPQRDENDLLTGYFSYHRNNNQIEPKLRFPLKPMALESPNRWTFEDIVERVVLGPTHATPLAHQVAARMCRELGRPSLAEKVHISDIPYRGGDR